MSFLGRKANKQRPGDLRIDREEFPGWVLATERLPEEGERVHTSEGSAVVVKILGKTGSGGRLLELAMDDGRKAAFFAAADNVLVQPRPQGGLLEEETVQS